MDLGFLFIHIAQWVVRDIAKRNAQSRGRSSFSGAVEFARMICPKCRFESDNAAVAKARNIERCHAVHSAFPGSENRSTPCHQSDGGI
jgi:hypothetical protein